MRARTYDEIKRYLETHACEQCGAATDLDRLKREERQGKAHDTREILFTVLCEGCDRPREFRFEAPVEWPELPTFAFGGDEPSELIDPFEFRTMSDDATDGVPDDPSTLAPVEFFSCDKRVGDAIATLEEVLKFIPADAEAVPDGAFRSAEGRAHRDAHPTAYRRAAIQQRLTDLRALRGRFDALLDEMSARRLAEAGPVPAETELTRESLEQHLEWLERGMTGSGKLSLEGADLSRESYDTVELSGASLLRCTLDYADFTFARFADAALTRCSAVETAMESAVFDRAAIVECRFAHTDMPLSSLQGAVLEGGDFRGANADRGMWNRVQARRVDFRKTVFGDCVLDGALFEDCDFRDAELARVQSELRRLGSTLNATFRRCDLRGAKLEGRRLDGTRFIDCKLHGVTGKPAIEGDYVVERPDFSAAGDGSDVRDAAAVHALWGKPAPR